MTSSIPCFDSFPSPPRTATRASSSSPPRRAPSPGSHQPTTRTKTTTTTIIVPSFDSFPQDEQVHPPGPFHHNLSPKRFIKPTDLEIKPSDQPSTPSKLQTSVSDQVDRFLNSLTNEIEIESNHDHHHRSTESTRRIKAKDRVHPRQKSRSTRTFTHQLIPSSSTTPKLPTPSSSQTISFRDPSGKLIFFTDLTEDTFNLHHRQPDRIKVPRYRRAAAGRVLGLDSHLRITSSSAHRGDGLQLGLQGRSKGISLSDPAIFHLLNDKNLKRISLSKSSDPNQPTHDHPSSPFIPLLDLTPIPSHAQIQNPQRSQSIGINLYDEPEGSDEDDLLDYEPPDQDGGQSYLDRLHQRKTELEQRVTQRPGDVQAWLALVDLQDEMKELGLVGLRARGTEVDPEAIRRHIEGTSDLKISYLKRALSQPSNEDNERLLLAYIKAYCDLPDVDLAKEWRQILESHPSVTSLWIAYVDWKQTEAGSMNVLEMIEVYEELIDRLVRRAENLNTPEKERSLYEQSIVYLFHRCCVMLKQAGYAERATVAFQAIMELNFFSSLESIRSLDELIEDFEAFWDSEAPRLGELGAKGWVNTKSEYEPAALLVAVESAALDNSSTEERLQTWQARELKAQPPRRTSDVPDDEEDPFGCVLFDDLRNLLFLVSTDDSRQALVYSFLSFVGLSTPPPDIGTNVPFFTDPFLSSDLIDSPERQSTFWPQSESKASFNEYGPTERISGIKRPQMIPFRIFPADIRQLFADPSRWFVGFDPPKDSIDLIRNSFQVLRTAPKLEHDIYFKLCELSFEARVEVSAAVKLAKQFLSVDQSNLILWDAYARLCLLQGKPKQARDVYIKALEMLHEGTEGLLSLWYSWSEMEFQLGHFRLVISILARSVNCLDETPSELVRNVNQTRSPALLLRVRRAFTGQLAGYFHDDVPLSILRQRVTVAVGFGNFEYLTEGFRAGCETYERSLEGLEGLNSPAEEEELWINYSRLIYLQIQDHQSYKPIEIRKILQRAIQKFPNNSIFLSLFAFNESKMKIDNQTRRLIDSILLNHPHSATVNSWLYAIWVELNLNSSNFNQAAVRNLFERALTNQSTRSCLQIWLLYIEFEIRNENFSNSKSLITRSLANCPWAKELYLIPFSTRLQSTYDLKKIDELKRMLKLMDEKCIRLKARSIRSFLDTIAGDIEQLELNDEPKDSMEAGELAEFKERIKLLPY